MSTWKIRLGHFLSVFIGFCHLGFDQYMFSGVGCLNLHTGKFLGALCGGRFHEAINKLDVLEPSVQGTQGQGNHCRLVCVTVWLSHRLPAEAGMGGGCSDGQVLGWGALALTDPDTGTVFEDEPLMEVHNQTDLQRELEDWLQQASASLHS